MMRKADVAIAKTNFKYCHPIWKCFRLRIQIDITVHTDSSPSGGFPGTASETFLKGSLGAMIELQTAGCKPCLQIFFEDETSTGA